MSAGPKSPPRGAPPAELDAAGPAAAALRRSLTDAFDAIGGPGTFVMWASDNPAAYYKLLLGSGSPEAAAAAIVTLLSDRPLSDDERARYSYAAR